MSRPRNNKFLCCSFVYLQYWGLNQGLWVLSNIIWAIPQPFCFCFLRHGCIATFALEGLTLTILFPLEWVWIIGMCQHLRFKFLLFQATKLTTICHTNYRKLMWHDYAMQKNTRGLKQCSISYLSLMLLCIGSSVPHHHSRLTEQTQYEPCGRRRVIQNSGCQMHVSLTVPTTSLHILVA